MIDCNPTLFSTLKYQNKHILALDEHIKKLQLDYLSLFNKKWIFEKNDLFEYLLYQNLSSETHRLNIFATIPPSFKICPYDSYSEIDTKLKLFPKPFLEKLAHLKKSDFSKRHLMLKIANDEGYNDYIFTDSRGFILETTLSNIFWIKENTLLTPHRNLPLYFGVTLQNVIFAAKKLGYQVAEVEENNLDRLIDSNVFICNSLKEICPVRTINGRVCSYNAGLINSITQAYEKERQSSPLPSLLNSLKRY